MVSDGQAANAPLQSAQVLQNVSDIYKTPGTPETRYRARPGLHIARPPALRHSDLHAGLWAGIGLLAAAILIVIAFTTWLLRTQSL